MRITEELTLDDGKYKFIKLENGSLICHRYGHPWREFVGDKAVGALFDFAVEMRRAAEDDRGVL